ncbi:(d)CMP kinase [Sporosarcina pasteurii]|uniref:Cytidylate kinase n=1 Tax=Sporosarcina pasteurii TaxID=1474 RepID=A0A380BKM1_SPOPA|nr:(d)CMP kinase [Sporosarcina pasteurii]MDS9470807.1 (d)CMP kinase [Sporosarcina pasteurii]QBQ05524.1 (d)CMP kinase [Sporosarcina pasteurii]SUJ02377.1 Cytidylate kinase [Sporosarcina pasteurii]
MLDRLKIAIDGPAAAGKSTIAKITAEKLGYTYIDTGAMYRALTYKALKESIDINDGEALGELLEQTEILLVPLENGQAVKLDGVDVSEAIRTAEVTAAVSQVSAHNQVRELMVEKQRNLGRQSGVVMDGRDIGTHVLPNAELKVFMTASVEERALRRYEENKKRGIHSSLEALQEEIRKRDEADSNREVSPLKRADDAILLDTTSMNIEEVAREISRLAKERLAK